MGEAPRWLRHLLRLYPGRHRRRYGEEMWEVVRYRWRSAPEDRSRTGLLAETVWDLVWNALKVWAEMTRRRTMGMGGWILDARFVARSLRRSPGYALTAVVVLAGAVAVNTAVFSFVRGTLLNEPTYPGADRVVVGWGSNPIDGQLRDVVSGPTYLDLRERTRTVQGLSALHVDGATLMEDGRPTFLDVMSVSVDFFDAVPVEPYLGRTFDETERMSSGPAHVMVSYAFWQDRLGGDPEVVGRTLPLNGEPHTVVGVLPRDFQFIMPVPVWAPLHDDVLEADDRYRIHYHLAGRLRPGVTPGEATRELSAAMEEIAAEYPGFEGWSVLVEPFHEASVMAVRPALWLLSAAMGVVLLIALVNLTTLFRIRTLARDQELGVRRALGAGRARVARLLSLEAVGLALAGSGLGLLLAPHLLARIRDMVPVWVFIPESAARVPALQAVLDPWVAGTAVGLALLGTLALTLPQLLGAGGRWRAAWAGRGDSGTRGLRWLVAAELALATVLCMGAGLTSRSADKMLAVDVGLEDEGLLTLWFGDVWELPEEEQVAYYRRVVGEVEALPQVASAALIDYVPFQQEDDFARIYFLDRSSQPVRDLREEWRRVSYGLFETAGTPVLQGRSFTREDFEGRPRTAVVNRSFAEKHYPDGQAVGQLVSTHDEGYRELEIVGVMADVRTHGPTEPAPPTLFVPLQGSPRGTSGMYVRSAGPDPSALAEPVREAIWAVDSSQPVTGIAPMTELVAAWVAVPRAIRSLVAGVAGLALFLSAVGVFGVVGYAVRRRMSEFGVRVALGASPDRLRRDVLAGSLPLVALGVGAGVGVGWLAARAAGAILFQVEPLDPISVAAAVAAMGAVALVATWVPARRASRVDPTRAIRAE